MAGKQEDGEDPVVAHGPRECMPCRGTGSLISGLGGKPSTVTCPWCEGGGVRLTVVDAQAKWLKEAVEAQGGS